MRNEEYRGRPVADKPKRRSFEETLRDEFPPQVTVCSERLPEPERSEFLRLHRESRALRKAGAEKLRQAWKIYRETMATRQEHEEFLA